MNSIHNGCVLTSTCRQYSQACKAKNATILGFSWTGASEIAYFSTTGIEIYSVLQERRVLKSLRSQGATIAWYSFCPKSGKCLSISAHDGTARETKLRYRRIGKPISGKASHAQSQLAKYLNHHSSMNALEYCPLFGTSGPSQEQGTLTAANCHL